MITKKQLYENNVKIHEELMEKILKINKKNEELTNLNLKYMILIEKYNKLLDSCLSKETKYITYNGDLYGIKTIDYHKDADSVDTISIEAEQIPREKGLINNIAEPFKNVAKEFNKLMFGNEEEK